MVATDVEKNPRETQVFKTRVPPFTFPMPILLLFFLFSPPTRASSSFPVLLSSSPCFFFFPCSSLLHPMLLLLFLLPQFYFFGSAFSKEVFRSYTSSFISGSSSSSSPSLFFFYGTRVFKTQVPFDKNISMSAIKTWVFVAQFLFWTQASKARDVILFNSRDVILFNSFQFLLTNSIVWQTHATSQITPPHTPPPLLPKHNVRNNERKKKIIKFLYLFSVFIDFIFQFFHNSTEVQVDLRIPDPCLPAGNGIERNSVRCFSQLK